MELNIVLAVDKNGGIGKDNRLPWRLKTDMAFFKDITTSMHTQNVLEHYFVGDTDLIAPKYSDSLFNAVIMGRKTWESLPKKFKPLPDRENIILSKTIKQPEGAECLGSLEEALRYVSGHPFLGSVFVIGGAQIYTRALQEPSCKTIYLTYVDKVFDCDTYMDLKILEGFAEDRVSQTITENDTNYVFKVLKRK